VRDARRVERRPRAAAGGAPVVEDQLFFPKLVKHAKWVFVLLAIVFAVSFAFLGVGSGAGGIGDLFNGNWGDIFGGGGTTTSAEVEKDKKRIEENPKDWAAYKALAAAQAADGKLDEAIATLQQLKSQRPKDVEGLTQLAGLYRAKADEAAAKAQAAQLDAQVVVNPSTFAPAGTTPLGKAYQSLSDPVVTAIETKSNEKLQTAYSAVTSAYAQAAAAYGDVAKATPNDPLIQLTLAQMAEQSQDTTTAKQAYQRFLKLAPDDPTAPAVRDRLKQLAQQPTVSTG